MDSFQISILGFGLDQIRDRFGSVVSMILVILVLSGQYQVELISGLITSLVSVHSGCWKGVNVRFYKDWIVDKSVFGFLSLC